MALNKVYNSQSNNIATYDWTDIASGTGSVIYYLCATNQPAGLAYTLVSNTQEGAFVSNQGWQSADYVAWDLSPFKRPKTIEGTAHFYGDANWIADGTITAYLVHYRPSTTTETTIGAEVASSTITADSPFNLSFVIAEILFQEGDILRLYVKMSTGGGGIFIIPNPAGTYPVGFNGSKLSIPEDLEL